MKKPKEAKVAIKISDKMKFKTKNIARDNEGNFMMKVLIYNKP